MKHRHQFLFLCLFCYTFIFMIPSTTSRSFLFEGWFEILPSLSTIYLACHLATAHTTGIRLLSSLPWMFVCPFSFAQISLQSKFQVDFLHYVLQECERIPFSGESNVQHLQWAHEGPQVPQHKSLLLARLLLWAEVLFICHIITIKKDPCNFDTVTFVLGILCFVPYPLKWYCTMLYSQ